MTRTNILTVMLLCLILGTHPGWGQGFYVTAGAGYSLSAGTQVLGVNRTLTGTTNSDEGVFGSFGQGFKLGASGGYMFSKNLGAELGFSYWFGDTFELKYTGTQSTEIQKWSGSGFVLVPSVVLSTNMGGVDPYARLGLVIGIPTVTNEYKDTDPAGSQEATLEDNGNLAFGYAGAFGVVIPTGGRISLFAEAAIHSVTYSPEQMEITKFTVNGVDRLSTLSRKEILYKESFSENEQGVSMAVRRPFSSFGVVVGARMTL
jgi:hypothetical protein